MASEEEPENRHNARRRHLSTTGGSDATQTAAAAAAATTKPKRKPKAPQIPVRFKTIDGREDLSLQEGFQQQKTDATDRDDRYQEAFKMLLTNGQVYVERSGAYLPLAVEKLKKHPGGRYFRINWLTPNVRFMMSGMQCEEEDGPPRFWVETEEGGKFISSIKWNGKFFSAKSKADYEERVEELVRLRTLPKENAEMPAPEIPAAAASVAGPPCVFVLDELSDDGYDSFSVTVTGQKPSKERKLKTAKKPLASKQGQSVSKEPSEDASGNTAVAGKVYPSDIDKKSSKEKSKQFNHVEEPSIMMEKYPNAIDKQSSRAKTEQVKHVEEASIAMEEQAVVDKKILSGDTLSSKETKAKFKHEKLRAPLDSQHALKPPPGVAHDTASVMTAGGKTTDVAGKEFRFRDKKLSKKPNAEDKHKEETTSQKAACNEAMGTPVVDKKLHSHLKKPASKDPNTEYNLPEGETKVAKAQRDSKIAATNSNSNNEANADDSSDAGYVDLDVESVQSVVSLMSDDEVEYVKTIQAKPQDSFNVSMHSSNAGVAVKDEAGSVEGPTMHRPKSRQEINNWLDQALEHLEASVDGPFPLTVQDIDQVIMYGIEALKAEPLFVKLESPVAICGDIHGNFSNMLTAVELARSNSVGKLLFLGNYVNGGSQQLHVACYMLLLKARYPDLFHFLRGHHDTPEVNMLSPSSQSNFGSVCKAIFPVEHSGNVWCDFNTAFRRLPAGAVVDNLCFCSPGGLAAEMHSLEELESDWRTICRQKLPRRDKENHLQVKKVLYELMSSNLIDESNSNVTQSEAGMSLHNAQDVEEGVYEFTLSAVNDFLSEHNFSTLVRRGEQAATTFAYIDSERLVATLPTAATDALHILIVRTKCLRAPIQITSKPPMAPSEPPISFFPLTDVDEAKHPHEEMPAEPSNSLISSFSVKDVDGAKHPHD